MVGWCSGRRLPIWGPSVEKVTTSDHWNHYWRNKQNSQFVRKSWSKIRIMKLLDEFVVPGMTILDAGCGSGFYSDYFISKGGEVTSLDYSDDAINLTRHATHNQSKMYLKENLLNYEFAQRHENYFDLAFTDGLLEHFSPQDQAKIIYHLLMMLRKGGIFATFVPNRYSWWQIIRPFVMPQIHETPFTLRQLEALHKNTTILKKGGINVLPFSSSPDRLLGSTLGMILYCIAQRKD